MHGGDVGDAEGALPLIWFAGRRWTVKTSQVPVGPGPNLFSAERVSVDSAGQLHLTIEHVPSGWSCAEVVAQGEFGYGSYRWRVASELNAQHAPAVLGLFLWSDEPAQAHRELDIEFSRWGEPARPVVGSFTVPNAPPSDSYRFPAGAGESEHTLTWSQGRVAFRSRFGTVRSEWVLEGAGVPSPGGGVGPRINLWLFRGQAPGGPLAVTIGDFSYDPAPPRPTRE